MSWSVGICGIKQAVLAKIEDDFNAYPLFDPAEQAIKMAVKDLAKLTVADMGDEVALRLSASGSMSNYGEGKKTQSVTLSIEPIYGFVT